jgi:hypothetical protein
VGALCTGGPAAAQVAHDAVRALEIRSEGLNIAYGLGETAEAGAEAVGALAIRSQAMNERYGVTGGSGAEAVGALAIRSQAMNDRYGAGTTVGSRTGFDWADAGVGITVALGAVLMAAAGIFVLRRQRRLTEAQLS